MQPSVSGAEKLLIWALWDDRLLLVTWVVVDVEWPLIYEGHYCVYVCCSNLWKNVIMALENSGNFFSYFVATLEASFEMHRVHMCVCRALATQQRSTTSMVTAKTLALFTARCSHVKTAARVACILHCCAPCTPAIVDTNMRLVASCTTSVPVRLIPRCGCEIIVSVV